jgi:predicted ferric reductase
MTRIKLIFAALCLGLTVLWLEADRLWVDGSFSQLRLSFLNYTGVIAMAVMAVALLLALRSTAMEPHVGGLDKSYRLHKWLGVAGLVMAIAHWLWVQVPSWLIAAGAMSAPTAPNRSRGISGSGPALIRTLQGPARGIGQLCFWAALILILLALVKWFPYRQFLRTHRFLAIVYLGLVFHSIVLLNTSYWTYVIGWIIAALMAAGSMAAVYILFKRVGRTRQAVGAIEAVTQHQDGRIVAVRICLKDRWPGHDAGQFAFVRFADDEEPHPFTISSSWHDDGRLTFVIKGLGDYTSALPAALTPGALVTVEGPYGRFTFNGPQRRQIWISAGIGITPFVSRMQQLATRPDGKTIDLFHATSTPDVRVNEGLWRLAAESKVRLHVWVAAESGRLTAAHIMRGVPEWKAADIWFCGPVDFGKRLERDFRTAGLTAGDFHQELFHFR